MGDGSERYLDSEDGPVLDLGAIAREIIVGWLRQEGIGPTTREAAERLCLAPTTLNQIVKGERRMTVEKLSYPVAEIGGDPGAFFERHELLHPESRRRREAKVRALQMAFPPGERELVLQRLAELKRLGTRTWETHAALVDALLSAAKARR